eukprot:CAMPEP_0174262022 /NCGR_PEP_ID=MMETSP0439-20130205/12726_1 /TAXON_ID=0 /ORGANISM="Stereomyxa ramosa, Strain Chinc5" /LENGTH=344 /DNA_ID=CAMNT_0015346653 /DNA_START=151 /DNA_END=1185 /DNA_ORIENTATION=-
MFSRFIFSLFLLFLFSPFSVAQDCHWVGSFGEYDLRGLQREIHGEDWKVEWDGGILNFNPCHQVSNELCAGSSSCMIIDPLEDDGVVHPGLLLNYGTASSAGGDVVFEEKENGFSLKFFGDSKCVVDEKEQMTTVVEWTCSSDIETVITQFQAGCHVYLSITSPYACPTTVYCAEYDKYDCEQAEGACEWDASTKECNGAVHRTWFSALPEFVSYFVNAPVRMQLCLLALLFFISFCNLFCICVLCGNGRTPRRRRNFFSSKNQSLTSYFPFSLQRYHKRRTDPQTSFSSSSSSSPFPPPASPSSCSPTSPPSPIYQPIQQLRPFAPMEDYVFDNFVSVYGLPN